MNKVYSEIRTHSLSWLCMAFIFVFVLVFYTVMHPLYIVDTDDWAHLHYTRPIYPIWHGWNPAKVFPEVLMPICFEFALAFVFPFCHDVTVSMCVVTAFVMAMMISLYIFSFMIFIKKYVGLSEKRAVAISLVFFLLHFLIFRGSKTVTNMYAFYSYDVNCYYNYIIPSLLCSIIVLQLWSKGGLVIMSKYKSTYAAKAMGFLLVYIALFSNLYSNVILVLYVCFDLLLNIKRDSWKSCLYSIRYSLGIVFLWIVVLFFEGTGGRSNATPIGDTPYYEALFNTLRHAYYYLTHLMSTSFHLLGLVIVLTGFLLVFYLGKEKKTYTKAMVVCIGCLFLSFLYCFLLCGLVDATYIKRTDVMFGFSFFLLFSIGLSLSYIIKIIPKCCIALPFLAALIVCQINTHNRTFRDIHNLSPGWIRQLNNRFISEVVDADRRNIQEMTLDVPKFGNPVNWPMDKYYGDVLRSALHKYGFVSGEFKVNVVFKEEPQHYYPIE